MKNSLGGILFSFCFTLFAWNAYADDVVGVMRVDAGTNGLVEVQMPFEPIGNEGPRMYIAGLFTGSGDCFSDRLYKYETATRELTNVIWNANCWVDSATGDVSRMPVSFGDWLFFMRPDESLFDFTLFGRLPNFSSSCSQPCFSAVSVDPTNDTVRLKVSSSDVAYDVFSSESTNAVAAYSSHWMHLARFPAASTSEMTLPSATSPGRSKLFLAANAFTDSDSDGISDALEFYVYGTSMGNADSDGDGIEDGLEVAWGLNPILRDDGGLFAWRESFEKPGVSLGDIAGQNGWRVRGESEIKVVGDGAFDGSAHLSVNNREGDFPEVSRDVSVSSDKVWVDMRVKIDAPHDNVDVPDCALVFTMSCNGGLIASDGALVRTNNHIRIDMGKWSRFSLYIDYDSRLWDLYLDGMIVFKSLALRGLNRFENIAFANGSGAVDDIKITSDRPLGLSSDGDCMPDEWEFSSFGNLLRDGTGDFDDDGLSDAMECAAHTNPMLVDSDFDGIPDNWEVENNLNPLDAGDAKIDSDGDGMSNALEYRLKTDPFFHEPDPRFSRAGLFAEFFKTGASQSDIPDFEWLVPLETIVVDKIDWQDGSWPMAAESQGDYFACRVLGYIRIPEPGKYTFYISSDDGVRFYIDGKCVVSDESPHAVRESSGSLYLESGWRPIELYYYENSYRAKLSLSWSGPNLAKTVVGSSNFRHVPPSEKPPRGFSFGLDSLVYSCQRSLTAMPDFALLVPDCEFISSSISFPATIEPWEGMPESITNCFAVLFNGYLIVEESGEYDISLDSDDGSRLFIDGNLIIDNNGNHSMRKKLATLALSEGLYGIRLEYYENTDAAGLELRWAPTGKTLIPVQSRNLCREVANLDSDSDGMPDWWEEKYGLDMYDGADVLFDLDGDLLTNIEEFLFRSNPLKVDSDFDGMPDNWEKSNGLCPFINDAIDDADNDGLVNVEEFRHGTNPLLADTDGDGCSDKTEIFNTRGNPIVSDILWPPIEVSSRSAGSSFISSTGTWRTDEAGTASAAERAGSLTWRLRVPSQGADALAVRIGQHNSYSKAFEFDLSLKVDGVFVTRELVFAEYGSQEEAYFFLPEIPHGEYEFTLVWHNWEVNTFLSVYDLRFVKFGGPDFDGDGIADWKNYRFSNSSEMDALPCESLVSPLCVEGRDLWRDVLEIDVEYPETNAVYSTVKTIGDGFYADIPLPLNGRAIVSMKDRELSDSFPVVWKSFDVFTEEYATNALLIRAGDSLKIAPYQESESEISISVTDSENNWRSVTNWISSTSMPYCFATNGLYLVKVTRNELFSSKSAYALVDVVSSRFLKRNPAILIDIPQTLTCPNLSVRNILEHDSELKLDAEILAKGVELSLFTSADRDLGMVSRLAEGGAISDAVQVTPIWADNGTYYRVAESYADGSQLIVVSLLFGAVAEDMTIELEIFVSGVTFEDGSRFKTLTAKDLDENGHYTIRFIRARGVTTSVCHRTYIYQDGKLLYTNK